MKIVNIIREAFMKIHNINVENNRYNYTISVCGKKEENYFLGLTFFESAKTLKDKPINTNFINTIIPSIVCYSYAIEYLSCSILDENKIDYPKSNQVHNLKFLFEKFPPKIRAEIIELYNSSHSNKNENFLQLLDTHKATNNSWRYSFEIKHSNISFLHNYTCVLIEYIKNNYIKKTQV